MSGGNETESSPNKNEPIVPESEEEEGQVGIKSAKKDRKGIITPANGY